MKSNAASPNELIGIGIILIAVGIYFFSNIEQATRVKEIIGPFVCTPLGIVAVIIGVVRKFRKQ